MIPKFSRLPTATKSHIILSHGQRKNVRHHAKAPAAKTALQQPAGTPN